MTKEELTGKHIVLIRTHCFDVPVSQGDFGDKINFTQAHISRVENNQVAISKKLATIIEKCGYLGRLNLLLKKSPHLIDEI